MEMIEPKKFYKATMQKKTSFLIKRFFIYKYNQKLQGNTAIDLGCGVGNDTEYLLSKGFKVTAIDSELQVENIIKNRNFNTENLKIIIGDFSKIKLPKTDLMLANFSLFFVEDKFTEFMENLLRHIKQDGFFVGNFLGKEDDWNKIRTTVDKKELLNYFNNFEMSYFSEEKYYKDTATGKNKFWHVYTIIAQKK